MALEAVECLGRRLGKKRTAELAEPCEAGKHAFAEHNRVFADRKHAFRGHTPAFFEGRHAFSAGRVALHFAETGAGNGNRTRMASLEGWNFTIKLCPRASEGHLTERKVSRKPERGQTRHLRLELI